MNKKLFATIYKLPPSDQHNITFNGNNYLIVAGKVFNPDDYINYDILSTVPFLDFSDQWIVLFKKNTLQAG